MPRQAPGPFQPWLAPGDRSAHAFDNGHDQAHAHPAQAWPHRSHQQQQPQQPPPHEQPPPPYRSTPQAQQQPAGGVRRAVVADTGTSDSITQGVCLMLGLGYFVTGGVALARSVGSAEVVHVAGLGFTTIAAIMTIGIGILLAFMGALSRPDRAVLTLLGVMMIGVGLVIGIEPLAFGTTLGATSANGVLLALTGATLVVVARFGGEDPLHF